MKTLSGICLLLVFVSACRTPESSLFASNFNTGKLPEQLFTINPAFDTLLTSAGGIRIHIAKGSFEGDKPVTIEWKEALRFEDMLRAGLLTQSGKEILSSGGMFYLNTKEDVALQKPIEIDVPTNTVVQGMQLYKGDSADGKIDWQEPKPIENAAFISINSAGKSLYLNNCAQCHGITKEGTGPALAGVRDRGPWSDKQKLYAWTHNPAGFMASDKYTQYLKCKYGVVMQAFPSLSEAELDSLYNYIDDEAERLGFTALPGMTGPDSCIAMQRMYDSLSYQRNELEVTNNNTIDIVYNAPVKTTLPPLTLVDFVERKSDYYKITIDVTGWYNVDVLLENRTGLVQSKLIVKLEGVNADKQEVYFAVPSMKVIGQGGYINNSTDIGFANKDGSIPLPQQTPAFVFAIGEQKGKLYFSKTEFITSTNQTITLTTQELTREQFDKQMLQIDKYGLTTNIDTTIYFSSLKSVDESLEKLEKDLQERCSCWGKDSTSAPRPALTTRADNTTNF